METVTILEFRRNAEAIINKVSKGKRMLLTYRGKPVIRLEPVIDVPISSDDPFYTICDLAASKGGSLANEEIDKILYGK